MSVFSLLSKIKSRIDKTISANKNYVNRVHTHLLVIFQVNTFYCKFMSLLPIIGTILKDVFLLFEERKSDNETL